MENWTAYYSQEGDEKEMKHLRNPTRKQSILILSRKLNPDNWLVERDTPEKLIIVSRSGKQKRPIYKEV